MTTLEAYRIAMAAGWDAANRAMRKDNAPAWTLEHYDISVREFNRVARALGLQTAEDAEDD